MQKILEKFSNRKNILILLGIFIIIEVLFALLLPIGDNHVMIDMAGSMNSTQIYNIIEGYDVGVRHSFIIGALTLDVVFPIVYFLLFAFLLFSFWKKAWMAFLPLSQAIFDLAENTGIVIMLKSWPDQLMGTANAVVIFSWAKWGFCALTVLLIITGVLRSLISKRRIS